MNTASAIQNLDTGLESQKICIGVITSAHGVKGYVKFKSFTENPDDILGFKNILDDRGRSYKVKIIGIKKDFLILAVEGINSRNDADKWHNTKLYVTRAALPATKKDEYYHADLIGLEVRDENGIKIGYVEGVENFGAGDILNILDLTTRKVISYPFIKQFVPTINLEEKYVSILPLEEIIEDAKGEEVISK
jgi:16S rRNA processing protein RimM